MSDNDAKLGYIEFPYKAFISYSHRDAAWGDWLHKALERYRVPKRLIGISGRGGAVPETLFPIFRDREELPSSADLPEQIKHALERSAYLIVICSPNSATSRWVNEEILAFKRLGRENRILAIIVDGEPNASDMPDTSSLECFPPALRYRIGLDGQLTGTRAEPMAADAREQGDGKDNAQLKLAAGLLGVGYNQLKQREVEVRRNRLRTQIATAGAIAATFFGVVVYFLLGQTWDASADQFFAEARADLSQRDFIRAEIAAAKALTYRDRAATRELLLTARLGGTKLIANSAGLPQSTMNVFSHDVSMLATVLKTSAGLPSIIAVSSPVDRKELWRIALPAGAGEPDAIAFDEGVDSRRRLAVAWPEKDGAVFRAGIWTLTKGQAANAFQELTLGGPDLGRHSKRIPSIAFSPTAAFIVTSGEDGKLCLWDVSLKAPKLVWEQGETHDPNVHGIAFNRDGSLLASGGGDYHARVWEISAMTGPNYSAKAPYEARKIKPLYDLKGHSDSVFAVAFSPDGQKIATGGYDRTIRIWDFNLIQKNQPQTVATLSGHTGTILSLSFSEDSKLLSSGASDGGAGLWDTNAGRLLNIFRKDGGAIRSVISKGFEGGVHIGGETGWSVWAINGGSLAARLWNGGAPVGSLAFDPTGRYLAGGGYNDGGRIRIWDRSNRMTGLLDPKSEGDNINGVAFSPDGKWIVAGGDNNVLHVWALDRDRWRQFTPAGTALTHDGSIWGLCFDPDGKWLATGNQRPNVQIKLWNLPDWSLKAQTADGQLHDDSVYSLVCDTGGQRIVAGDSNARISVLNVAGLSVTSSIKTVTHGELNVWSMALADPPHAVLSGNSDGRVRLWIPDDKMWAAQPLEKNPLTTSDDDAKVNPTINSVAYDRKHGWVAAGGVGSSVEIYDIRTLHRLRSLKGTDGTIWWVTFDPEGARLAYGGLDGIVRIVHLDQIEHLDQASPAQLYEETQRSTGLTMDDSGNIIEMPAQ